MLLKAPTWRRDHVQELLDSSTPPNRKFDDRKTISAYNFYKEFVDADRKKHVHLERYYPKYTGANELHSRTDLGFRWYVEAAIMADIPTVTIAEDIGLPAEVISAYEELFFDVRSQLKRKDYIVSMIFFPSYRAGIHGRDFDSLWKMMAYYGSFDVVRDFNAIGEMSSSTKHWVDLATRTKLAKNAFIASQILTPNQYNATEVIDSYITLLKLERDAGNQTESEVMASLHGLFKSFELVLTDAEALGRPGSEPRFAKIDLATPNPLDDEKATALLETPK